MTWQEQLNEVVVGHLFGSTEIWPIDKVKEYLTTLESLGATDIVIPDYDTLYFVLPENEDGVRVLLFIMINGKKPTSVDFDNSTRNVKLHWDW